jgi:4a-hydroxytetrahydrobiopterin dehydratase
MPPRDALLGLRCRDVDAGRALAATEAAGHARALPGWHCDGAVLRRRFVFGDFHETMAFVNAVAWIAHREDHHPEIGLGHGHCELGFSTHSAGGLTLKDFICAARVDALLDHG